jgi:hypothetical protein
MNFTTCHVMSVSRGQSQTVNVPILEMMSIMYITEVWNILLEDIVNGDNKCISAII